MPPIERADPGHNNFYCPLAQEWIQYKKEAVDAMQQLQELHTSMPRLIGNTNHLGEISNNIKEMKDSLVSAVVGKDQIPASTAEKNMDSYRRIMVSTIAAISFSFTIIIIAIIGAKTLVPNIFTGGAP